mmetsp:Transcript_6822/g.17415  ORF Transcript_6822/g.17415 Transcript_6822/m.17415 type:complete len:502 (-) Transcript_6822:26-1531(-)
MRSLRTLCVVLTARKAAGFAICKPAHRPAAFRSPVSDGETSHLVSMRSTVADSESSQQVEIKLAAPAAAAFVETLFEKTVKVKAGTVDKRRTTKRARGQNPIVVGSPDNNEPAKDRRRKQTTSTDALFTTQLLDAAQERRLGGLTVELLRLENVRDDLLRERGGRTPESLGYAGDNELEDQLLGVDCDGFRADWCSRAELKSPEELTKRIRDGRAARQALVAANMRLVVAVAKRYAGLGMGLSDLVQEGSLGLMRAATKYDPARGCKFSTYACWWIQQAVLRAVAFQSRLIRLPMHVHQDLAKATRAQRDFIQDQGREPTDEELAKILDMTVAKLRRVRTAAKQSDAVSTETPRGFSSKIGGGEAKFNQRNGGKRRSKTPGAPAPAAAPARTSGRTLKLEDTLESAEPGADRAVEMSLLHGAIAEAFKDLDEDEQKVISLRYGLEDGVACSPSQVAERCAQSKDWVRRCEMRAIRKLRKPHHLMTLRPYNSQRQSLTAVPS